MNSLDLHASSALADYLKPGPSGAAPASSVCPSVNQMMCLYPYQTLYPSHQVE